jgi:hypothetical protein
MTTIFDSAPSVEPTRAMLPLIGKIAGDVSSHAVSLIRWLNHAPCMMALVDVGSGHLGFTNQGHHGSSRLCTEALWNWKSSAIFLYVETGRISIDKRE